MSKEERSFPLETVSTKLAYFICDLWLSSSLCLIVVLYTLVLDCCHDISLDKCAVHLQQSKPEDSWCTFSIDCLWGQSLLRLYSTYIILDKKLFAQTLASRVNWQGKR